MKGVISPLPGISPSLLESLKIALPGFRLVLADKDGDLDFDPLTSTSWDGDAIGSGGGTIDWNALFGVPDVARAVLIYVAIRDNAIGSLLQFKARSTTTQMVFEVETRVANAYSREQGVVPIAMDGTSYYFAVDAIDNVIIRVVGWYR